MGAGLSEGVWLGGTSVLMTARYMPDTPEEALFPSGLPSRLWGILSTRKTRLRKWTVLARNADPGLQAEFCLVPNPICLPAAG